MKISKLVLTVLCILGFHAVAAAAQPEPRPVTQPPRPVPAGQCDLAITKQVAGDLIQGEAATFTITVINVGSASCVGPIEVSDPLPAGLSFSGTSSAGWTCDGAVECSHEGSLSPGKSLSLDLAVAVASGTEGSIRNCASVRNGRSIEPRPDPPSPRRGTEAEPVLRIARHTLDIERANSRACDCSSVHRCPDATISLDTGYDDHQGTAIEGGQPDDDWRIVSGTPQAPAVVVEDEIAQAWGKPVGTSQWISIDAQGGSSAVKFLVFERCFCLGPDFADPQLQLTLRADNRGTVLLNGVELGSGGEFNGTPLTVTEVTGPEGRMLLTPGRNCLRVVVSNYQLITGLSLSGSLHADHGSCPCAGVRGGPDEESF